MYGRKTVTSHSSTCQNCAREDGDLAAVRRLYVMPEAWDSPGSVTRTDEVELWCYSCRTQYPHEDAEPDTG